MGGKGSGGARRNSGPKRRDPNADWLAGHPGKRPQPSTVRPKVTASEAKAVQVPTSLTGEEQAVWKELAAFAMAQGTLEPGTVVAFAWLCRLIVLERKLSVAPLTAAGPDHRGMCQRVENLMARFRVVPDGKPAVVAEPVADDWAEFETKPELVKRA